MRYLYHILFGVSIAISVVVFFQWVNTADFSWAKSSSLYIFSVVSLCLLINSVYQLKQFHREKRENPKKH